MTKTPPRRIPRTQADVDKAYTRGVSDGINNALSMMLWVLMDYHGGTQEELQMFSDELHEVAEHIQSKRINLEDIQSALKDEYDLEICYF